jgi:mycothiol system anti-sigma-R factor
MNCQEIGDLMDGYLDGELDALTSRRIEQHLQQCRNCEEALQAHTALAHAIRESAPYYKAPTELRQRIQSSLRAATRGQSGDGNVRIGQLPVSRPKAEPRAARVEIPWNWLALAAAIVVAAIIGSTLLPRLKQPDTDQFLATQLIASHVRSLMADHLMDVASSDQHTVKPWLDAKLDFAAPVADLSDQGFPLIGGRLDYLDNRPVAALVYQRRKHFINLFIWPASREESKAQQTMTHQGYHLLHWADADFNYWAISDVNKDDLQNFQHLFEKQIVTH